MNEFNRAARVSRGGEGRGERARVPSSPLRSSFGEGDVRAISPSSVAQVHRASDLTHARAERHYQKHRDTWVAQAYTRLLLKAGPTLALTPPGLSNDLKPRLYARANHEVARNYARRLTRIDNARYALIATGRLRDTRDLEWNGKSWATAARLGDREPATVPGGATVRVQRAANARVAVAQEQGISGQVRASRPIGRNAGLER